MDDKLYTVEEAAELLKVSYQFIYLSLTKCKNCNKSKRICTCGNFEPSIKGIDISKENSKRSSWRINKIEIDGLLNK